MLKLTEMEMLFVILGHEIDVEPLGMDCIQKVRCLDVQRTKELLFFEYPTHVIVSRLFKYHPRFFVPG